MHGSYRGKGTYFQLSLDVELQYIGVCFNLHVCEMALCALMTKVDLLKYY